jgi:hypothetical protein
MQCFINKLSIFDGFIMRGNSKVDVGKAGEEKIMGKINIALVRKIVNRTIMLRVFHQAKYCYIIKKYSMRFPCDSPGENKNIARIIRL